MANYLITGYHGEPHVTAENDRGINAATFGVGKFVLPVGEQFKAEYIGNNTIRMYDGKLMNNGAAAGIAAGEYIDFLLSNTSAGMKRNDFIIFQYSKDPSTLIESGSFVVVQGVETSGTPTDPELTQDNLLSGDASFDQTALWRIKVEGTTINTPERVTPIKGQMKLKSTNTPQIFVSDEYKTAEYWFDKPIYTKTIEYTAESDKGSTSGINGFSVAFSTPNFAELIRSGGSIGDTGRAIPCFCNPEDGGGYVGVNFMNHQGVSLVANKYVIKSGTRIRLQLWYTKN